ncbi:hypothetical protein BB561_005307 [Smittium simulii]|uniref:Protein kinase domain-containing protein n=1 Tax=Smittium simulii TaxID=133385 RepID=A0A2T9YB12_9FUNG|nr:hypothetical protein BB561_005307 [Smittium simulii]
MSRQNNRPMTRGLRKAIIQDEVFLTPRVPASRLKRRQASKTKLSKSCAQNKPSSFLPFSVSSQPSLSLSTPKNSLQDNSLLYHQSPFTDLNSFSSDTFFGTPTGTKLVRPDPGVFHSTGFLIKKNQQRADPQSKFFTPETPCKKTSSFPNKSSQASAPPSFALSGLNNEPNTPLHLGKHPNISFESLLYNKRRYVSPSDAYSEPFASPKLDQSAQILSNGIDKPYSDDIFQPNNLHSAGSFPSKPSSLSLNLPSLKNMNSFQKTLLSRTRGESFAISEVETTFSNASTLQTFGNRAEPNVKIDKSNFDHSDLMQCDSGLGPTTFTLPLKKCDSNHFSDSDNFSKSPLSSSSPLITPDERPQMPQIVNGYATNYPHFLNNDYFIKYQNTSWNNDFSFQSPTFEHCPVDESGYLDYYRYQFDEIAQIGKGNFSSVFLSRSLDDGKTCAIKKSLGPFTGRKDRVKKLSEVGVLWKLSGHPNIIQIINSWEQFGLLYIQTEFYDRGNLRELFSTHFNSDPIPEDTIWKITSAVANGLFYIHSLGMVHLDLKPDNICVDNNGFIKLIDLGHATALPIASVDSTDREGDRVYLAPESLSSSSISSAVDIFSLGLIALEMAANVVLPDNGPEWLALRSNDISSAALDPSSISSELYELIIQMLQKDPHKRPSAEQICSHPKCIQFNQNPLC